MNIGIDFDNTITEHPRLFKDLVSSLSKGNKIYIISSCDKKKAARLPSVCKEKAGKLAKWGISYKELLLAEEPIPKNKAKMCVKYKIDIMIDDDKRNISAIKRLSKGTVCLMFSLPARVPMR